MSHILPDLILRYLKSSYEFVIIIIDGNVLINWLDEFPKESPTQGVSVLLISSFIPVRMDSRYNHVFLLHEPQGLRCARMMIYLEH